MIDPKLLCNKHLLGEHGEIHKHRHNFVKKHSIKGRIAPIVQIEPMSMKARHDELTIEMERRFNKSYDSSFEQPNLSYLSDSERLAKVDVGVSKAELLIRCDECRIRICQNL